MLLWLLSLLHHARRGPQERMLQLLLGRTGKTLLEGLCHGGSWGVLFIPRWARESGRGNTGIPGRQGNHWITGRRHNKKQKVVQQWPRQLKLTRQ